MFDKTTKETLDALHFHRFFYIESAGEGNRNKIQMLGDLARGDLADRMLTDGAVTSFLKGIKPTGSAQKRAEETASELLLIDMEMENPHGSLPPEYSIKGFNQMEDRFHPIQSPKFKDLMTDDYIAMQFSLGIPADEEAVRTMFKDIGVPKMFHTYGILASQWFQKQDETWTAKASGSKEGIPRWLGMGQYHYATRKYEPISLKNDEEFYIMASAFRKLDLETPDSTKLFSLLIHLYEHYSNENPDWKNTWDEYIGAEPYEDHLRPQRFARHFFIHFKHDGRSHSTTARQVAERQLCEDIEEWGMRDNPPEFIDGYENDTDYSTWETFIRDKHFHYYLYDK